MLSVIATTGLDGLSSDGLLGLAPSNQMTLANVFIDKLYDAGVIDNKVFSFYLRPGKGSKFTVGGYDLNLAIAANKGLNYSISWNNLVNSRYWTVPLYGAAVGDRAIPISVKTAIVDTGTSYLLMPKGNH
jgi:cathepsin D